MCTIKAGDQLHSSLSHKMPCFPVTFTVGRLMYPCNATLARARMKQEKHETSLRGKRKASQASLMLMSNCSGSLSNTGRQVHATCELEIPRSHPDNTPRPLERKESRFQQASPVWLRNPLVPNKEDTWKNTAQVKRAHAMQPQQRTASASRG